MTTAPTPNSRASLLAGLRTGGVRSASTTMPHTAAPGGSFNVPRFASQHHSVFPEEEDEPTDMQSQPVFSNVNGVNRTIPMTAAVDSPNNRFSQQQGPRGMNPNSVPFSPAFNANVLAQPNHVQTQALQMQMMQLEILRIQVGSLFNAHTNSIFNTLRRISRLSSTKLRSLRRPNASNSSHSPQPRTDVPALD
jgi:hypothetical protein